MKHRSKRFLSILLSIVLVLGLMLGMSLTAYATEPQALNGNFTINAGGDKVNFAPGNLQYNGSEETYKWRFAQNQYNKVGAWDANTWVDLFGLGTWTGSSPNPLLTSSNDSDYIFDSADFTKESLLANESQRSYDWRTLTSDEWTYLFNTRATTSGIRYAKAVVNDVNGVILLPDNWDASYHSLESTNTATVPFSTNTITSDAWASDFEAHGAVFLPVGGYRDNTTVISSDTWGCYISSSNAASGPPIFVNIFNTGLDTASQGGRTLGFSVRLVKAAPRLPPRPRSARSHRVWN